VGAPRHVVNYLGRYTHRVAISNNRRIACEDGKVSFKYRDYADVVAVRCAYRLAAQAATLRDRSFPKKAKLFSELLPARGGGFQFSNRVGVQSPTEDVE
jgi:hypothetical protein